MAHREPDAVDLNGLAIVAGSGIFATGSWGLVLRSRDFGATWEKLKLPPDVDQQFLWSVAFADAKHGWVVGQGGTIISTTDGGTSWQHETSGTAEFLYDVAVMGSQVYAAGENFTVLRRATAGGK